MQRNSSTLIPLGLVAVIGLGMPALAKSMQSGKTTAVASANMRTTKTDKARALNAQGTIRRTPTLGAPNPNSPTLVGGGSGYDQNLYVY